INIADERGVIAAEFDAADGGSARQHGLEGEDEVGDGAECGESPHMPGAGVGGAGIRDDPISNNQVSEQSSSSPHNNEFKSPYLKPYMAATIVDPRLDMIKPSQWTNVSKDDEFLRSILKLYFLYEYHFFSAFHKDLFLDDMLSGSTEFCSSLLVNAVLAISCNCCRNLDDRTQFWDPHTLGYKFAAEARRLWELEVLDRCSVTAVQAAMMMNVTYNLYAMDKVGMVYDAQAVALARELKLFDTVQWRTKREWVGYGFTAWSLYFWREMLSPVFTSSLERSTSNADARP
ncbi:hypothetical protein S40285_09672, partial [Stachybotrys chlorohalonatus IBT 40285]